MPSKLSIRLKVRPLCEILVSPCSGSKLPIRVARSYGSSAYTYYPPLWTLCIELDLRLDDTAGDEYHRRSSSS